MFANWFVRKQEEGTLTIQSFSPKIYIRYVDDIFTIFYSQNKCDDFFEAVNNLHFNLKHSIEKTKNGSLPFLDVRI